jgi:hypothetical protein
MKFKNAALALAVAGLLSAQVHAGEVDGQVQAQDLQAAPIATLAAFDQTDINAMFEQVDTPMQLAALTSVEMKETEGALWQFAVGGFAGGLFNGISYRNTSNRTWGGWGTAISSGVVGGAVGGIRWWSAPIWGGGIMATGGWAAALLHNSKVKRGDPNPRRSYAMATTGTVVGRPICVKRLSSATRTCNSTT